MSEGYDMCECLWGQYARMQRLLSSMRDAQGSSYCIDTECTDEPLSSVPGPQGGDATYFVVVMWVVLAALFFFMRSSGRAVEDAEQAKRRAASANNNNNNDNPPPPPSAL